MTEPDFVDEMAQAKPEKFRAIYNREYDYGEFCVATRHGMVSVYVHGRLRSPSDGRHTRMDFCHDGRRHIWTWHDAFQDRYLVTLANRMAEELSP